MRQKKKKKKKKAGHFLFSTFSSKKFNIMSLDCQEQWNDIHLNKTSATYLLSVLNENDATFLIIKCVSNVFYIKKGPIILKRTRQMFY